MDDTIVVNNLIRVFSSTITAVDDISFTVRRGELFGFLGPNGAGKSTTLAMLTTLLSPTRGTATVAGYDIRHNRDAVRRHIGIIFQEMTLDVKLTAFENLNFHGILYGMDRTIRIQRINALLEMVELQDRADSIVQEFSGGMKRRLEIARGLLHLPEILFLDEPTLGLDPQSREHIWNYLNTIRKERQITVFFTTHYLDEVEHCDRIAILDHGKLIALDTPEMLKRQFNAATLHHVFLSATGYRLRDTVNVC